MQNPSNTAVFVMALGTLAALIFAYSVSSVLSPLLLFGLTLFVLLPLRDTYYVNRLLWIIAALFLIWFYTTLSAQLLPFILAFVLAYLFEPLMDVLARYRVSRTLSALLITLVGVGSIGLVLGLTVPVIIAQVGGLVGQAQNAREELASLIDNLASLQFLESLGFDTTTLRESISNVVPDVLSNVGQTAGEVVGSLLSSIPALLSTATTIILVPFLSFFFLQEFPSIKQTVKRLIPPSQRNKVQETSVLVGGVVQSYLRGTLINSIILTVIYSVCLYFIGVKYPLLLGFISGIASFVPYVGLIVSVAVTLVVTLFGDLIGQRIFFVAIMYVAVKIFEDFFLVPNIIGKQVGLNPIVLILSITLFGHFFGLLGIIVAVPISAVLVTLFTRRFLDEPPLPSDAAQAPGDTNTPDTSGEVSVKIASPKPDGNVANGSASAQQTEDNR